MLTRHLANVILAVVLAAVISSEGGPSPTPPSPTPPMPIPLSPALPTPTPETPSPQPKPTPTPTPQMPTLKTPPSGVPDVSDPLLTPDIKTDTPVSSTMVNIFDTLGLTQKSRASTPQLDIPDDLTGVSDEKLMDYTRQLLAKRKSLQWKMTRHVAYSGFLMMILRMYGSSSFVQGTVAALFWLNNNYRATINADWTRHQIQLNHFILEMARVKGTKLDDLPKSRVTGTRYIRLPVSEKRYANFPVWLTEKGQPLPNEAQLKDTVQLVKNRYMKK